LATAFFLNVIFIKSGTDSHCLLYDLNATDLSCPMAIFDLPAATVKIQVISRHFFNISSHNGQTIIKQIIEAFYYTEYFLFL
jgi:hypothetical protein